MEERSLITDFSFTYQMNRSKTPSSNLSAYYSLPGSANRRFAAQIPGKSSNTIFQERWKFKGSERSRRVRVSFRRKIN